MEIRSADDVLLMATPGLSCGRAVSELSVGRVQLEGQMPQMLVLLGWVAAGEQGPVPAGQVSPASGRVEGPSAPLPLVRLTGEREMTLADALNEVLRQTQGGAWIVWHHERDDGRIGCRLVGYFPNGYLGASSLYFAVDPG